MRKFLIFVFNILYSKPPYVIRMWVYQCRKNNFPMKLNYDFFLNKFNNVYNNDIRLVDLNNKWWYHNCRVHFAGNHKHSFHIVTRSPWPLYSSIAALMFTFGMVMHMHNYFYGNLLSLAGFFFNLIYDVCMVKGCDSRKHF